MVGWGVRPGGGSGGHLRGSCRGGGRGADGVVPVHVYGMVRCIVALYAVIKCSAEVADE